MLLLQQRVVVVRLHVVQQDALHAQVRPALEVLAPSFPELPLLVARLLVLFVVGGAAQLGRRVGRLGLAPLHARNHAATGSARSAQAACTVRLAPLRRWRMGEPSVCVHHRAHPRTCDEVCECRTVARVPPPGPPASCTLLAPPPSSACLLPPPPPPPPPRLLPESKGCSGGGRRDPAGTLPTPPTPAAAAAAASACVCRWCAASASAVSGDWGTPTSGSAPAAPAAGATATGAGAPPVVEPATLPAADAWRLRAGMCMKPLAPAPDVLMGAGGTRAPGAAPRAVWCELPAPGSIVAPLSCFPLRCSPAAGDAGGVDAPRARGCWALSGLFFLLPNGLSCAGCAPLAPRVDVGVGVGTAPLPAAALPAWPLPAAGTAARLDIVLCHWRTVRVWCAEVVRPLGGGRTRPHSGHWAIIVLGLRRPSAAEHHAALPAAPPAAAACSALRNRWPNRRCKKGRVKADSSWLGDANAQRGCGSHDCCAAAHAVRAARKPETDFRLSFGRSGLLQSTTSAILLAAATRCPSSCVRRWACRVAGLLSLQSAQYKQLLSTSSGATSGGVSSSRRSNSATRSRSLGEAMANAEALLQAVHAAQEAVGKQGDTVRSLKAELKDGKVDKVRKAGIPPRSPR